MGTTKFILGHIMDRDLGWIFLSEDIEDFKKAKVDEKKWLEAYFFACTGLFSIIFNKVSNNSLFGLGKLNPSLVG